MALLVFLCVDVLTDTSGLLSGDGQRDVPTNINLWDLSLENVCKHSLIEMLKLREQSGLDVIITAIKVKKNMPLEFYSQLSKISPYREKIQDVFLNLSQTVV